MEEKPWEQNAGTLRGRKQTPLEQDLQSWVSIVSLLLRVKMPPDLYLLNQGSQRRPGTRVGTPNPKTGRLETPGKTLET